MILVKYNEITKVIYTVITNLTTNNQLYINLKFNIIAPETGETYYSII